MIVADTRYPHGGGGGKGGTPDATPPIEDMERQQAERQASEAAAMEQLQGTLAMQQEQMAAALAEQQNAFAKAQKAAEEAAAKARRDQERASGYGEIDNLYMSRLEAEETAMETVDQELINEESNARLRGVEFAVTEEQREARIQKRFEEFWGKEYEQRLGSLIQTWGRPEMKDEERLAVEQGQAPVSWTPDRGLEGFDYTAFSTEATTPAAQAVTPAAQVAPARDKPSIKTAKAPGKDTTRGQKKKSTSTTKLPPGLMPGVAPPMDDWFKGDWSLLGGSKAVNSLLGGAGR